MADAYQQVFLALSTAMDNWAAVNEFRSVVRRLREFEAMLPPHAPPMERHRATAAAHSQGADGADYSADYHTWLPDRRENQLL